MKRQIFTALSLTLLVSSPLTLNAMHKSKKKKKSGGSHITLNDFMPSNVASSSSSGSSSAITPHQTHGFVTIADVALPATLDIPDAAAPSSGSALDSDFSFEYAIVPQSSAANSSSAPADEFDPKDTAAQRAALFGAIVAIQTKKNKGLNHIDAFHALQREAKLNELYQSETHTIIPTTATSTVAPTQLADLTREERYAAKYVIAQWRLNVTKKHLTKTREELAALKKEKTIDLFPSSPTPQPQQFQQQIEHDEENIGIAKLFDDVVSSQFLNVAPRGTVPTTIELQEQLQRQQAQQRQQLGDDEFDRLSQDDESTTRNHNDGGSDNNNMNTRVTSSMPTTTTTPAPATSGGWSVWGLLGYKK